MTKAQIEWIAETKDRKFGRIALPWNEQVEAFNRVGASVVLPENIVEARLAGYDGFSRTRLIAVKVKGGNTLLYKGNELTTPVGAKEMVIAHAKGKYPTRSSDFYDAVKAVAESQEGLEPEDRTAVVVSQNGNHSWTKEMKETKCILGPEAAEYFANKVEPFGRTEVPFFDLEQPNFKDVANFNYMWFSNPQNDSRLDCGSQVLHNHDSALGVLEKTAEGGSRSAEKDILTDIRNANLYAVTKYLEERGMTGLADKFADLPASVVREYKTLPK